MAKGENDDIKKKKETEYLIRKLQNTVYKNYLSSLNIAGVKKAIKDKDDDFFFSNNDTANKEVNKLLSEMAKQMNYLLLNAIEKEWNQSQETFWKNAESKLAKTEKEREIFNKIRETATQSARDKTAQSFYNEKRERGLNISDRVWNLAGNAKKEIEIIIQNGIKEGKSADDIQKSLKGYLNEPEKLFRRVRNKETGELEWSKAAQKYKPGQGVYRSAYKNAMRLARTELKAANCEAVWNSAQNNPLITGWKIVLSNNHTTLINGVPTKFKDICDTLQGIYPKTFKFKGWHPQCRCEMIPILITQKESKKLYKSIFDNKKSEWKPELINKMPDGFNKWIEENKQRQSKSGSVPYFIRDNFVNGNLADGLKYIAPNKPIKPVKTEQQKADIQARWNTRVTSRKYNDQLQEIKAKYGKESNTISDLTDKISKEIQRGADISKIDSMMDELKHKSEVKAAWDERVEINRLETLLVDVKNLKKQFDIQAIESVFNAVEKKLATWENLPLEQQVNKLNFEIDWVEKNKKYDTWKVAKDAYKKRLEKVEYLIGKQVVKASITHAIDFAKSTKSEKVKQMAEELSVLLDKETPVAVLQEKAHAINLKVAELEAAKAARQAKKYAGSVKFDESSYSQERKNNAMWEKKSPENADKKIRDVCGKVWQNATQDEKEGAYYYTHTYSSINEPLRGITYYGDKSVQESQSKVPHITSIINKSSYDFDIWVQRGVDHNGFTGLFGMDLRNKTIEDARKSLLGKTGVDKGFSSCAVVKGRGFSKKDIVYNIYCPRGTKMLYLEPFSSFGRGTQSPYWDGKTKQSDFGYEVEMLLQRNTTFRITKIEKSDKWYIDVEVIGQL